jgi:hypothetical protein
MPKSTVSYTQRDGASAILQSLEAVIAGWGLELLSCRDTPIFFCKGFYNI